MVREYQAGEREKGACAKKFRHDRHICLQRRRNRQRCSSDRGCYAEPEILVESCPAPTWGNFIVSLEPYKNTILYQTYSLRGCQRMKKVPYFRDLKEV